MILVVFAVWNTLSLVAVQEKADVLVFTYGDNIES